MPAAGSQMAYSLNFQAPVEAILSREDLEYRIFEAALACSNTLKGNPGAGVTDAKVLAERVLNPTTPARLKGFALASVAGRHCDDHDSFA